MDTLERNVLNRIIITADLNKENISLARAERLHASHLDFAECLKGKHDNASAAAMDG